MKEKILVVEDQYPTYQKISAYLGAFYDVLPYTKSVAAAKETILKQKPHLILLDIELDGKEDGIDLGKLIKDQYSIPFIFMTRLTDDKTLSRLSQFTEFYIEKPITRASLTTNVRSALKQYFETIGHGITATLVYPKTNSKKVKEQIPFADITYITTDKARRNCLFIHTSDGKLYEKRITIGDLEMELPDYFKRLHNSFVVNSKKITRQETFTKGIYVENSPLIPIGDNYKEKITSFLKLHFA